MRRWILCLASSGTMLIVPTDCWQAAYFALLDLLGVPHIMS